MVGMARCAVPARVQRAERQACNQPVPRLHDAGTPQRGVPTSLNTYSPWGPGERENGPLPLDHTRAGVCLITIGKTPIRRLLFPLPEGESQGEGERLGRTRKVQHIPRTPRLLGPGANAISPIRMARQSGTELARFLSSKTPPVLLPEKHHAR